MDIYKIVTKRREPKTRCRDFCLNFAKQEVVGLRVTAWRMLSRLVVHRERPLKNLYKNMMNLHMVSSHLHPDRKMSAMSPRTVSISSRWMRAKSLTGRSVSLGLCP